MHQDQNYLIKLLVIGSSPVGKSSLVLRFSDNIFNEQYTQTIGIDIHAKTYQSNASIINLQMFEISGSTIQYQVIRGFSKGATGIILAYDITNHMSFRFIQNCLNEVNKGVTYNAVKLLVGNKSDLEGSRQVTIEEGKRLAESFGIKFVEASAKDAVNVEKVFTTISKEIKAKIIVQKLKTQLIE